MSDEVLRRLEREVAAQGSPTARVRLANELERQGRQEDAVAVLFEALEVAPQDPEVRLALGHFRGLAPGEWCLPSGDERNTRRSTAKGPRGEGRVLERRPLGRVENALFTRGQDERVTQPRNIPPPLRVGPYVYYSFGIGRCVLAATADGHVVTENSGASGFEWSANRDGKIAWRLPMPIPQPRDPDDVPNEVKPEWWSDPYAVIAPDATVFGVTSLRRLIAIEPNGDTRFDEEVLAKVNALALDFAREKLHVLYSHPVGISTRDLKTGKETAWVSLDKIVAAHNAIVCDDGRVACVSAFGGIGIVSPDGRLEREIRYMEKLGGAEGGLTPWGELVVVSFDASDTYVHVFDPASGARRGGFHARECWGAPVIDSQGTIYLDGGPRYVAGFDVVSGQPRFHVDRPSLWRAPDQPSSQLALREDELAFLEIDKSDVVLVRVGA